MYLKIKPSAVNIIVTLIALNSPPWGERSMCDSPKINTVTRSPGEIIFSRVLRILSVLTMSHVIKNISKGP